MQHRSKPQVSYRASAAAREQEKLKSESTLTVDLHLQSFLISVSGVFIFSALLDGIIYKVFRLEHLSLMYEVVSFTALASFLIGVFGIFDTRDKKKQQPLFYKTIRKQITSEAEHLFIYRRSLLRYAYMSVGALLYAGVANAFIYLLLEYFRTNSTF